MQEQGSTSVARIPVVKLVGSFRYAHARSYEQVAEAIVDPGDVEFLGQFVWCLHPKRNGTRYAQRSIWRVSQGKGASRLMHVDIYERHNGPVPEGFTVDHQNRDGLDNRTENLRLATTAQQGYNKSVPANSKHGYKGVHWFEFGKRFKSFIRFTSEDGRIRFYLGSYRTPDEAATAYNYAAERLHGEFACLNEIPEGAVSEQRSAEILATVLDRLTKPVSAK